MAFCWRPGPPAKRIFTHCSLIHTHTPKGLNVELKTQVQKCKPRPWEAQLMRGLGSQTLQVSWLQEQGCVLVSWVAGRDCKDSCVSEGQEVVSGSHYSSQLMPQRCFTRKQSAYHFSHSAALCHCFSCCSLWSCFTHFPWLLLTAGSVGISWLLGLPHCMCSSVCMSHITLPREGVSSGQLVILLSGTPVCLGPHCRTLTGHWVPSEPAGRWLPLTQAQVPQFIQS